MRRVTVQDAKKRLSQLLREVEAGHEIAITRRGCVIARLVRAQSQREWGFFAGQVTLPDDALDPLDEAEAAEWDDDPAPQL